MKKVFVNIPKGFRNDSFITPAVKEKLAGIVDVTYNENEKALGGEELKKALAGFDAVITGWGQPKIMRDDLDTVKIIVHTGGTVGGIVDLGVFDGDVTVLSGNDFYSESVAEGVISYMLFALRKMGSYSQLIKNCDWTWEAKTEGLLGQSVGLVSLGAISKKLIPMLKPFTKDIKVYSTRPNPDTAKEMGFTYAGLDEIFKTCKIVSVHTAMNSETRHMINKHHFDLLSDGALFINTSRGGVIDEVALCDALKENRFTALLDVYDPEPPKADNPLLKLDNTILFPHMAGPTYDRREKITLALIDDMMRFFGGETPKNIVTKEVAQKMTVVG
ncbi:MAG: hydroxyacid dehydrogenase [Clostridia bacterium]|nr:hydroxyacid dehydrogenase [Clostridia bacterium]